MSDPCRIPFLDLGREIRAVRPGIDAAISRVLDRGRVLLGPELEAFESELADWCGGGTVVGVASGLDAIELLLRAHGIGPGDEVIVPSNTCIATWIGVTACGAAPVPVEPDPATRNLGVPGLEAARSPRTRAVMGVNLYGLPCDIDGIREFCRENRLTFLLDAAQSIGATWRGSRIAALGDGAALSFYPTKNLGALGDAGAVWTDDLSIADQVRLLRNYGQRDRCRHDVVGRNSRLEEIHAAVLRVKLQWLDEWTDRRRKVAHRYIQNLAGCEAIVLPLDHSNAPSVWHLFVIEIENRDAALAALAEREIGTAIHYPVPPHLSGAYRTHFGPPGRFPIAERMAERVLSLPLNPWISDAEVDEVCAALVDVLDGIP